MSAQDKRKRREEEYEKERRQGRRMAYGFLVIVVVLGVLALLVNTNLLYHNLTAVTIDGEKYTITDFNYYYFTAYSNYTQRSSGSYDTSKRPKDQMYSETQTFEDYFVETAYQNMKQVTMLTKLAKAENFTLPENYATEIDSAISGIEGDYEFYKTNYPSINSFTSAIYGRGATLKTVRANMEKAMLATAYAEHLRDAYEYPPEQLASWYDERKDQYDIISYRSHYVYADYEGVPEPDVIPGLEEDPDEKAIREAAIAERMSDAFDEAYLYTEIEEDEFKEMAYASLDDETKEYYGDYDFTFTQTDGMSLSMYLSPESAAWLLDPSRQPGDTEVFEFGEDYNGGYQVVYFVERDDNDYELVDVRHILIKPYETDLLPEAVLAEAKEKAENILSQWKDGPATEESFAELANEHSEDTGSNTNGGLYEKVMRGQMVPEFNDFCFDPARKPGDTGIVYGESSSYKGYHIMFYVGTSGLCKDIIAENELSSQEYEQWQTEQISAISEPVLSYGYRLTRQ